jgi:hypothetical protein
MRGTALVILAFVGVYLAGTVGGGVLAVWIMNQQMDRREHEHEMQRKQAAEQTQMLRQQVLQFERLRLQQQQRQQPLAPPQQFGPELMRRFSNQLDLTQAQRQQLRPIVMESSEKLRRLRDETAHSAELLIENLQDQISAVLTPDQRARFDEMIERWREKVRNYTMERQRRQAEQRLLQEQQQPINQSVATPAAAPTSPAAPTQPAAP